MEAVYLFMTVKLPHSTLIFSDQLGIFFLFPPPTTISGFKTTSLNG